MSLGTIHLDLYKSNAGTFKDSSKVTKISKSSSILVLVSALVMLSVLVSAALAAHASLTSISDGSDRINKTGTANSVIWQLNVTNQPGSGAAIRFINITNATGYIITSINATGNATQACTIAQTRTDCTGLDLAAGSRLLINVTTTQPSTSGERSWTVATQDTADVVVTSTVWTAAIDGVDLAFDIRDELGNVTANATVQLYNGSQVVFVVANSFADTDNNNGLILIESGNVSNQQPDTVQFNVTKTGFNDRNQTTTRNDGTTTSYDNNAGNSGWNNGFRVSGLLYNLKITIQDELGNSLSDATVNITDLPQHPANTMIDASTSAFNATAGGGVQYFALPDRFDNVTILVTRSGFINNATFNNDTGVAGSQSNQTFLVTRTAQQTGNSTYKLLYALKVNVTNELGGSANMNSGVTFLLNNTPADDGTAATANQTSNNVYYFAIPTTWTAVNLTASKAGFVNKTPTTYDATTNGVHINTSNRTTLNPQLLFTLKVTVQDELGGTAGMSAGTTIRLNTTATTADNTSSNVYYFNVTRPGAVNVSVEKAGYITNTTFNSTSQALGDSSQTAIVPSMAFTIRVTTLCNELGGPGHCYTMDGTEGIVAVAGQANLGLANTTYNGGDAYLNATGTVVLNVSVNGFVNQTVTIRTNTTTSANVSFNTTGIGGSTDNASAIQFRVKVLSVYDELGGVNFTLDGTGAAGAAVDVVDQINNVFYLGPYAYVNMTGEQTGPWNLVAYLVNQSFVNQTARVTPNSTTQNTVLFNLTNGIGASQLANGGLPYIMKFTVQDELAATTNMNSGVTFFFNDTPTDDGTGATAAVQSSNVYYFKNVTGTTPGGANVTISRPGYINASNNTAFTFNNAFSMNASNQTTATFSLNFNLKVSNVTDELSQTLGTTINLTANNTGGSSPNSTSGANSYYALPLSNGSYTGIGYFYINASKRGYVDNVSVTVPINTSTQAVLSNISLAFTVRVENMCDQLNVTCFQPTGALETDGLGGAAASGILSNYSGNKIFIAAPNGTSSSVVAFARGYVNRSTSVIPSAAYIATGASSTTGGRNVTIAFNTTSNETGTTVNASALLFTVRVRSICDQLNFTCFTLNSTGGATIGQAGVNLTGNLTSYSSGIAYIPVPGISAVNLVAFSLGYINSTQSVTPTPATAQVDADWNSTIYGLNYTLKLNVTTELWGALSSGVSLNRNGSTGVGGTELVENNSIFRTPNSNIYYLNITPANIGNGGAANITSKRDGYINTSTTTFSVNTSTQAATTLSMPFAVKITTKDDSNNIYTGATVQIRDASNNVFTVNDGNGTVTTSINNIAGSNTSGSFGDTNTSSDGYIYWALNQSNVTTNVDVTTFANRNGYSDSVAINKVIGYVTQLAITSANHRDTTAPTAATGVTAVAYASAGQINVSWTASTSSNVKYYQVYRNTTLLGTSGTTVYTDKPAAGIYTYSITTVSTSDILAASNGTSSAVDSRDTTAPAAATSVTATVSGSQITVTWTASTSSDASYYQVYRNTTLLTTTSSTSQVDYPAAGIYIYNITTVDTSGNLATSNGTSSAVTMGERTAPSITLTTPASGSNVTTTTPTITFTVTDNTGGAGINVSSIAINVSGLNVVTGCAGTSLNITCSFVSGALTDGANTTISIAAKDNDGNDATNASRNFGVSTAASIAVTLNTSSTSSGRDLDSYGSGWTYTFNVTLGSSTSNTTTINATRVKMNDWSLVGGTATIAVANNAVMNYTDANGTARVWNITTSYNETGTIFPLQDHDLQSVPINGTVTISMKIPAGTTPGTYSTVFYFGGYSVPLTGG